MSAWEPRRVSKRDAVLSWFYETERAITEGPCPRDGDAKLPEDLIALKAEAGRHFRQLPGDFETFSPRCAACRWQLRESTDSCPDMDRIYEATIGSHAPATESQVRSDWKIDQAAAEEWATYAFNNLPQIGGWAETRPVLLYLYEMAWTEGWLTVVSGKPVSR